MLNNETIKKIENFEYDKNIQTTLTTLNDISVVLCSVVTENQLNIQWNNYIKIKYTNYTTTLTTNTPQN